MALDPEERTVTALLAGVEDINARVDGAVGGLERAVSHLDPNVCHGVRGTRHRELAEFTEPIDDAAFSPERLRRSADSRPLLVSAGLSLLVVLITPHGFRCFMPLAAERTRLHAEHDRLQATVDWLAEHAGRAQLRRRGASIERLCTRLEPGLGRYDEGKDCPAIRIH